MKILNNNRGSGLISLLMTVTIIGLVYYFMLGPRKSVEEDKNSYLRQMSVDARSYNSMLEGARKAVEASKPRSVE